MHPTPTTIYALVQSIALGPNVRIWSSEDSDLPYRKRTQRNILRIPLQFSFEIKRKSLNRHKLNPKFFNTGKRNFFSLHPRIGEYNCIAHREERSSRAGQVRTVCTLYIVVCRVWGHGNLMLRASLEKLYIQPEELGPMQRKSHLKHYDKITVRC